MASSKYDEDVYENPFYTGIISTYPHVLEKIVSYKGVLCVPKFALASEHQLTKVDAMDHVLLPTRNDEGETEETEDYITASGKNAQICQGKIFPLKGFDHTGEIVILFTETFHTDAGGSYKVLCLDAYLNKEKEKTATADNSIKTSSPTNYQQCMDLLWSHSGGQKTRDTLDKLLKTFSLVYERLEGENLRSIVDAASTHFAKAMQLLLKDSVVRKSARHSSFYMDSLKLAVETYMMNAIHKRLFRVVTAAMSSQDAEINKITRNLVGLQLTDLGIRKVFSRNIPPAKKELSMLNRYSTPMGRLLCIKRIVTVLTKPPRKLNDQDSEDTTVMTSDDLLPIHIFLVIKSDIPNWYANLVYMRHFHFAKTSDDDEFGFYLATIEAALEHIKTGQIQEEIKPMTKKRERWNSFSLHDQGDLSPPVSRQSSNTPTIIEEFFRNVQDGNEKVVQALLEKPHKASEEIHLMLCHPLCSCDRCDRLLSVFRTKSDLVTAYTRDNRGYTALHMAAYYGQGILIDLLVKNHAVVDATDYLGLTPLHLACQRGYQNVMLLLLHFSADIMAMDNEGNTPLHLSCANGHEDCVKALVFYDGNVKKLQVNAMNEMKDTPLHLAAKWGFEGIVKTLLENGASPTLCNRKGQTPVSLAQNVIVQRLLQMAAEGHYQDLSCPLNHTTTTSEALSSSSSSHATSTSTTLTPPRKNSIQIDSSSQSSGDSVSFKVETASLEVGTESERRKRKEKLFKAIIEGDIQLVKFYLGASETLSDEDYGEDLDDVDSRLSPVNDTNKVLSQKIGVNIRTTTGSCPLHTAVLHNHSDIVELLISLDADTSAQNHKSLTPLHLTCVMRNSLVADMLVKANAKLDVEDMNGDTPLHIAASNGFINGVHTLIKAGANLNIINKVGNSALHEAAKRNLMDTMGLLVRSGIDITIRNKDGKLATDFTQSPTAQAIVQEPEEQENEQEVTSPDSSSPKEDPKEIHQLSIKELFAAFEETDLHTLQALTASIRLFDKDGSLKRASTRDSSVPFLSKIKQTHFITSFDKGTLRKVKLLDKSDPLYVYSLSSIDVEDDLLTPMGDNLMKSFDHFPSMTRDDSIVSQSLSDHSDLDRNGNYHMNSNEEVKCEDISIDKASVVDGTDVAYGTDVDGDTDIVDKTAGVNNTDVVVAGIADAVVTDLTKATDITGVTDTVVTGLTEATDITGVTDEAGVTVVAGITDDIVVTSLTEATDITGVTDEAGVTDTVVTGLTEATDITGVTVVAGVTDTVVTSLTEATDISGVTDEAGISDVAGFTDEVILNVGDVSDVAGTTNAGHAADVADKTAMAGLTDKTAMAGLTDKTAMAGLTDKTAMAGLTDKTAMAGLTDKTAMAGLTDKTAMAGLTDKTAMAGLTDYDERSQCSPCQDSGVVNESDPVSMS